MRWRLRLEECTFDIQYKKGRVKTKEDSLSRLMTDSETVYDPEADFVPVYITEAEEDKKSEVGEDQELFSEEWA